MNFRNRFVTLLCAAALAFSLVGVAAATEQQRLDEPSLFERYTNSAQDLILKGLELVGINYRRGGTNGTPTIGPHAEDEAWTTYRADTVRNYEIGVKGVLAFCAFCTAKKPHAGVEVLICGSFQST